MVRPVSLALLCLLALVSAAPADDAKRQQAIDLLDKLLQRAVPTAQVKVIAGNYHTIILAGVVEHAEDVNTILGIARAIHGQESGQIVNAMRVGGVPQVDQCRTVQAQVEELRANDLQTDRKSTRLNSSHIQKSRMPSSA